MSSFSVHGINFRPGAAIDLHWDMPDTILASATADSGGQFTATCTVPQGAPAGAHSVGAFEGATDEAVATFTVDVSATPTLAASPNHGGHAENFTLTGDNYGAGQTVDLYSDAFSSSPLLTTCDGAGHLSITTDVGSAATAGGHTISARDHAAGPSSAVLASCTFTVDAAAPTLAVAPQSGAPSSSVTFSGNGYAAGQALKVWFDTTVVATPTCDGSGAFSAGATVPAGAATGGGTRCRSTASTATSSTPSLASCTYTVAGPAAALQVSPHAGLKGRSVVFAGQNFLPNTNVAMFWDSPHTLIQTGTTDGAGSFSGAQGFVPTAVTPGTDHTINGSDGTNSANDAFHLDVALGIPVTNVAFGNDHAYNFDLFLVPEAFTDPFDVTWLMACFLTDNTEVHFGLGTGGGSSNRSGIVYVYGGIGAQGPATHGPDGPNWFAVNNIGSITLGRRYRLRAYCQTQNADGAGYFIDFWIRDEVTTTETYIGGVKVPNSSGIFKKSPVLLETIVGAGAEQHDCSFTGLHHQASYPDIVFRGDGDGGGAPGPNSHANSVSGTDCPTRVTSVDIGGGNVGARHTVG